ncbi:hypothetical protein OHA25_48735 [Nonomuraea sp. NBC_00507]|uniref:hypothetical protein n=1 Tax=Nonomuraea sp. NBC_00507 TaxID=2976002 RepID=UPI002E179D52
MWEGECDGACLIDHDERRLLLFCHCDGDQSYRLAALANTRPDLARLACGVGL